MNYGTMPIGKSGDRTDYNRRMKEWAEKSYGIIIDKSIEGLYSTIQKDPLL